MGDLGGMARGDFGARGLVPRSTLECGIVPDFAKRSVVETAPMGRTTLIIIVYGLAAAGAPEVRLLVDLEAPVPPVCDFLSGELHSFP